MISGVTDLGRLRRACCGATATHGWLGGVSAGIARRFGIDVSLVRLAFVVAAAAGGVGVAAYALGWLLIPAGDSGAGAARASARAARRSRSRSAPACCCWRCCSPSARSGIWFSDAIVWPLVLIAAGGALIWRQSLGEPAPARAARDARPRAQRPSRTRRRLPTRAAARRRASRAPASGIALVIAAGLVFLQATGALSAARDVLLGVVAVVVVLGVIFAPWIVRLVRSLTAGARRAHPLAGARRDGRAPARLRAPDARDGAAARRRPARGRGARPPPGARAARLARRAAGARRRRRGWRARSRRRPPRSRSSHGVPVEVVVVGDRELDAGARGASWPPRARR